MKTNRLASERSTYLRSAAQQTVDWYPWTSEAFNRAREEKKPVLLDIGASWCHWCHVMDEGTYENEEISSYINGHFIAVKVDRDERPDVDARYQRAVNAMTGQGGWPLTVFLDDAGRPFYGGTYFPPTASGEMPGFLELLGRIHSYYTERTVEREEVARSIVEASTARERYEEEDVGGAEVRAAALKILEEADLRNGGFGYAPKFPHTPAIELLLQLYSRGRKEARDPICLTLDGMLAGGIHDQVGGGFHRYSTDEKWIVPHFEKMAYDNAGLLRNYVHAWQLFGNTEYGATARDIAGFIGSTLSGPEGFYASQDADALPGDDGDYWTWSPSELAEVLEGDERKAATLRYHIHGMAEMHRSDRHVLFRAMNLDEIAGSLGMEQMQVADLIESARSKMLERRSKRQRPAVDSTVFGGWNGMLASSFFEYSRTFADDAASLRAKEAVDRYIRDAFSMEKGFRHTASDHGVWGLLEDQVHMLHAVIDLFETCSEPDAAKVIGRATHLLEGYKSPAGGLSDMDPSVYSGENIGLSNAATVPLYDSPSQSPVAAGAHLLLRVASLFEDESAAQSARSIVRAVAPACVASGAYAASIFAVLDLVVNSIPMIVVAGSRSNPAMEKLIGAAGGLYLPGKETVLIDTDVADAGTYSGTMQSIISKSREAGRPLAFSCVGRSCSLPVEKPEDLLTKFRR